MILSVLYAEGLHLPECFIPFLSMPKNPLW